jgi:hypothetical protein
VIELGGGWVISGVPAFADDRLADIAMARGSERGRRRFLAGKAGYDCKHPDEQDDGHAKQVQAHEVRGAEEQFAAR